MKHTALSIVVGMLIALGSYEAQAQKIIGVAMLANPIAEPKEAVIKGVTWRCEGEKCMALAQDWPGVDSFMKRCSTVAAALGPLASFQSGGRTTDKRDIATCNRLAKT